METCLPPAKKRVNNVADKNNNSDAGEFDMHDRPALKLVWCTRIAEAMKSALPFDGVDIGAQFMPRNQPVGRRFDGENLLGRNPAALVQPLPDHSLGDADTLGKGGLGDPVPLEVGRKLHTRILATLVPKVNSSLVAPFADAKHVPAMPAKSRPKPGDGVPDQVKLEEGRALSVLWERKKKRAQGKFADEVLGTTQSNFSHYIGGRRPIPQDVAVAVAKELDCAIEDFSPRLAKELVAQQLEAVIEWPFKNISIDRIRALRPGLILKIEGTLMEEMEKAESAMNKGSKPAQNPGKNTGRSL